MKIYSNTLHGNFDMMQGNIDIGHTKNLIIQLEDCINVMKGLYGNKFIPQFIVDYSCVHYQQREYGLNVNSMNIGHGRRQRIIRYSKMI